MQFVGLLIIFATNTCIAAYSTAKKEYAVDCLFFDAGNAKSVVTFLCDSRYRETTYFKSMAWEMCSNNSEAFASTHNVGTIHFRDCQMDYIPYEIFAVYGHLHSLDISSMELSSLRGEFFSNAFKLTALNASNNHLETVRSNQFFNATKLESIDFSYNRIRTIDELAFDDCAQHLQALDLSHNYIQDVPSTAFGRLEKLSRLNLSYNNLTTIEHGTFSNQSGLKTLGLSHNFIKVIDLDGVLPRFSHIETVELNHNQLVAVNGYAKYMFPSLKWIEVHGNNLGCEYHERNIPLAGFYCILPSKNVSNGRNEAKYNHTMVLSPQSPHIGNLMMIFGIMSFIVLLIVAVRLVGMRVCHYSVDDTDGVMSTASLETLVDV